MLQPDNEAAERLALELEVERLLEENAALKKEYKALHDEEVWKTAYHYSYATQEFNYFAVPFSMVPTPFFLKRDVLIKKTTASFMPTLLPWIKEKANLSIDFNPELHFAFLCESVIESNEGISFVLTDPYRTIMTQPIQSMNKEEALEYVGNMVIARICVPNDFATREMFELRAIKKISFNIDKRKEPTFMWKYLKPYLNTTGHKECIQAINEIIEAVNTDYPSFVPTEEMKSFIWVNSSYPDVRFYFNNTIFCIMEHEGRLYFAEQKQSVNRAPSYVAECIFARDMYLANKPAALLSKEYIEKRGAYKYVPHELIFNDSRYGQHLHKRLFSKFSPYL